MQFAHIAPTAYLQSLKIHKRPFDLLLAHLVESDTQYSKYYANASYSTDEFLGKQPAKTYILDNSAFELYRAGLPMFQAEKLIDLAKRVNANYIVLPDYPGESANKTIKAAEEWAPRFKQAGFGTFFVPQSQIGNLEEYISAFAWAASSPLVDYIGMSILGIPNAFGVDGNDKQRYVSRHRMFQILEDRGLLSLSKRNNKSIHNLGMTDGPAEIHLMREFVRGDYIASWDSSSAVWAGINNISYDNSPTGLIDGKVKLHVDFSIDLDESKIPLIKSNIKYIDDLVFKYTSEQ